MAEPNYTPTFAIHNRRNEIIASGVMPADWKPAPDIVEIELLGGESAYFIRRGVQDGHHSYFPGRIDTLPADSVTGEVV